MKKKRFKPQSEQYHGFSILEISTDMLDYLLAFSLNKNLEISLSKNEDLPVYVGGEKPVLYSMYSFCKDSLTEFYLIQNLSEQNQLMNSYLFLIRGHYTDGDIETVVERAGNMDRIFNVSPINLEENYSGNSKPGKVRKLVNTILTDLEYHMIELNRKRNDSEVKLKTTQKMAIRKLYDA